MTQLTIGLATRQDGARSRPSIVARVRRVDVDEAKPHTIVIPAGSMGAGASIDLPPGRYSIEALLPGGQIVTQGLRVGDGQPQSVQLRAPDSPQEWLSWQYLTGQPMGDPGMAFLDSGRAHLMHVVRGVSSSVSLAKALRDVWRGAPVSMLPLTSIVAQPREFRDGGRAGYLFDQSPPAVSPFQDNERYYCVVQDSSTGGSLLGALPVPWRQQDGDPTVDVFVDGSGAVASEWPLALSVIVRDSVMASVFGYLSSGNEQLAAKVLEVEVAVDTLYDKRYNPIAAAGAAYALIRSLAHKIDPANPPQWVEWIANLRRNSPWLPDGSILDGWAALNGIARVRGWDEAAVAFVEAVDRGLPMYTEGIRMLYDGLARLADSQKTTKPSGFDEAYAVVRQLSVRLDPRQTFTVVAMQPFERSSTAR